MTSTYQFGRTLDHVHMKASDIDASRQFYVAALGPLGLDVESGPGFVQADEFILSEGSPVTTGLHLAFRARDRESVDAFYKAAMNAGGRDNGKPGPRDYKPDYYGAFVLDPDGNNIEAVYDPPSRISGGPIVAEWD